METNGSIRSAQRSLCTVIRASISLRSSASKTGTTISCLCRQCAIPTEVLSANRKLTLNGASIELKPYQPAHTDSDLSVSFTEPDILHTGDTYWNGVYPFIDYSTGGSIDGMIAASDANLAASTDSTIIIPGHGKPVSNKSELTAFRDMLVDIRDKVAALKKAGRTLPETVAAMPTADHDAKWGHFVIDPAFFTKLVYEDV